MDEIGEFVRKYRGGCGCLMAILVLGAVGAIGAFISPDSQPPDSLMVGGLVVAIALGLGIWRNTGWARVLSGAILSVVGLGLAVFILYDFATHLIGGRSLMSGQGGGAFGEAVFIIFATGMALLAVGLNLLGWLKLSKA